LFRSQKQRNWKAVLSNSGFKHISEKDKEDECLWRKGYLELRCRSAPKKRANTSCTQMKWEVKGVKEIDDKLMGRGKKQQCLPTTFTRLRKSGDKGCIMMLERCILRYASRSPQNPFVGLLLGVHTILCPSTGSGRVWDVAHLFLLESGRRQWDRFLRAPGDGGQVGPELKGIQALANELGSGLASGTLVSSNLVGKFQQLLGDRFGFSKTVSRLVEQDMPDADEQLACNGLQWLCCVPDAVPVSPVLPSSADASWQPHWQLRSTPYAGPAALLS